MKYGARNQLDAEVVAIKKGQLMCQVTVKVPANATLSSVMTLDSLDELALQPGSKVKVITKAVNVMLACQDA